MSREDTVEKPLETTKSELALWLVKVPDQVADKWHEAIRRVRRTENQEGIKTFDIGSLKTVENTSEKGKKRKFQLVTTVGQDNRGSQPKPPQQQEFMLETIPKSNDTQHLFSSGGSSKRPCVEGLIGQRMEAQMNLQQVGVLASSQYQQYKQQAMRSKQFSTIRVLEDGGVLQGNMRGLFKKREKMLADAKKSATKRDRKSEEQLQIMLFQLFAQQQRWTLSSLQKETDQPQMHVKAVLSTIAQQVKYGEFKDLWELKEEFRGGGGDGGDEGGAGGQMEEEDGVQWDNL